MKTHNKALNDNNSHIMPEHVVILKTGRLHELELASNTLKEAGILHYKQEENITGLKTAMFAPVMGPGNFWNLLVPKSEKSSAEKILAQLPIDKTANPNIGHFSDNIKIKRSWKILCFIILFISGIVLLLNLYESIFKS